MSDSISRQAAIRWVKTECNPYGKPTLDYDSGLKVIEHLKKMPSADAVEVVRCKDCRYFKKIVERSDSGLCYRDLVASARKENGYCSREERREDSEA